VNVGGASPSGLQLGEIARLFAAPQHVRRVETLKAFDADWEPLTEAQSMVKVGDPVIQIDVGDEDDIGGIVAPSRSELPQAMTEGAADEDSTE
jgi:hypothetical protein